MKKRIVNSYFPKGFKYATPVLFAGGAYLIAINHQVWGVLLILVAAIILTTNYVTIIDLEKKTIRDYLTFLSIKMDEDLKKFHTIKKIVVAKGDHVQEVKSWVQSRQFEWSDYTATLVFDNDSLDLLTKRDKRDLLLGIKPFSQFLKVDVEDVSRGRPYIVDMDKVE